MKSIIKHHSNHEPSGQDCPEGTEIVEKDRGLESRCMFNRAGTCFFHSDYETKCTLCFNFSEAGGSRQPVKGLMQYLSEQNAVDSIFPSSGTVQDTLM